MRACEGTALSQRTGFATQEREICIQRNQRVRDGARTRILKWRSGRATEEKLLRTFTHKPEFQRDGTWLDVRLFRRAAICRLFGHAVLRGLTACTVSANTDGIRRSHALLHTPLNGSRLSRSGHPVLCSAGRTVSLCALPAVCPSLGRIPAGSNWGGSANLRLSRCSDRGELFLTRR